MRGILNVTVQNRTVTINFEEELVIEFECIWLRDHCRCSLCYHSDTFQRARHLLHLPDSNITDIKFDKDHISVTWDDNHESLYKADFLIQYDNKAWTNRLRHKPLLWHGKEIARQVAQVCASKFLNSTDGARLVFQSLLDNGIALINNVEPTMEATEEICKALGGVQHTMYGGLWLVHNKPDHADIAYTNIPLSVHTDTTYFTEAAGLQVFHGLEHTNGTGGETILVDGFYGAKRLEEEFLEDFEFLTTFEIDAEFYEDGHLFRHSAPIITLDKTNTIKQIRFNAYDRSPMAFSNRVECRTYYRALKNLSRFYEEPANQWHLKLKPGVVIAIDNFRVLHGRTSFTGNRIICGCYVSRSDWLDKARSLRLID